ncbi:MAG: cyclic nucleotide-binding domain-containing protein [Deltaproteobacteria bacterium]|nr:cyclic nucleotide-binding domain-containing protein [Deltaproteobacteria bacterium]
MSIPSLPTSDELAKMSKLFSLLDEAGRNRLLASASRRQLAASEVICREGEKGDEFFVVVSGKVSVSADDFGTAKSIAHLGRGAFFGEMAVVANQPRSATVTVVEACDLLVFGRESVESVLRDYPTVRQALGAVGVRRTEELLEKLSGS